MAKGFPLIDAGTNVTAIMPTLPPHLAFTQGKIIHCRPGTNLGGINGLGNNSDQAISTLLKSLARVTANRNDTVLVYGDGNASALCTDYQSATLNWSKDFSHIVGIHGGALISPRTRISLISTYATASNLLTVSANGCYFANLQFFAGVADANPTGAVKVTGSRNHFYRCHFAGIGNDANDIAGAYSLKLDGASENFFEECVIGLTTTGAGTAVNSDLLVDTDSARNVFKNCYFTRRIDHASNFAFVQLADATSIQDFLLFDNCYFLPTSTNYALTLAAIMKIPLLTEGIIYAINCVAGISDDGVTAPKWDANDNNKIQIANCVVPPADTAGITRAV